MARHKLTISYDGTAYCGWQVQSGEKPSIQSLVQNALQTALRHTLDLTGSGRTDAGVHARGQTAHFDSDVDFDPNKLRLSLNGLLPSDVRIFDIESVASNFHARYSAQSKIYHYHLHLDRVSNPFSRLYRHQVYKRLSLPLMTSAAQRLLGTHDFTSFANEPQRGSVAHDPIRTLSRLDIVEQEGGVRLEYEADGFLYKMVRNLTGTLIEAGAGRISPSDIDKILAAKDRRKAPATTPPHGLFLMKVIY
ncbi:MAG: tRNA pseudouridine(38-40) synthase TruA [Verrucomicrobia bacterium]|nr:tRNA pseudouridine(38-40) synthase TruA [Verrucomicrobiota bacterium]